MCVCYVFPGCAVSRWSLELCMHSPTKNEYLVILSVVSPTCSSPYFKNTQGWNFAWHGRNKNERPVPPPSPLLLVLLLQLYCFCCAAVVVLIFWVCFVFRLCRFTIGIPTCGTSVAHKIYVRKKTVCKNNADWYLSTHSHTLIPRVMSAEQFFVLCLEYSSRLMITLI